MTSTGGVAAGSASPCDDLVPVVPRATAARFAFPGRVTVAMVSDGAMQMGGMATSAISDSKTGLPGAVSAAGEFATELLPGR